MHLAAGCIAAAALLFAGACGDGVGKKPAAAGVIVLNPAATFQTMLGWEATAQAGQWGLPDFDLYRDEVLDRAVNELGINRIRMEVRSGAEHPQDNFAEGVSGKIERATWKKQLYVIVNDNEDPAVANRKGFHWSELDHQVDHLVEPLRRRLRANGEDLYVLLTYVDFGSSAFEHHTEPEEFAEFMMLAFEHMQKRNGWVPDAIEMVLEPDLAESWDATSLARAMVAAGDRLKAAGFEPDFIGPSTTHMSAAIEWFDEMVRVPRALTYLKEFAYHRYRGVTREAAVAIGERGKRHGLRTSMLEHIGSGHQDLHEDLKLANVSAWAQYTLAWEEELFDNGTTYFRLRFDEPNPPEVIAGRRTPFLRQYFRFIRKGAVRIEASGGGPGVDPLAFVHPDGRFVLVAKTDRAAEFFVRGLPRGSYGVEYTTEDAASVAKPDVAHQSAQGLFVSIPAAGVVTVFAR